MPAYKKMESLKNGGSWGKFWWKTCGFEWVKCYPKEAATTKNYLIKPLNGAGGRSGIL